VRKHEHTITVFEHETIRFDKGQKRITKDQFDALRLYYGEKGLPYYSICYNGIKFNEYVGVIQVGTITIEVLPKADKVTPSEKEEKKWRDILVDMLRAVGLFEIKVTSQSYRKIKPNTILDLYFELFIKEVEYLIHNGLIRQYRKKEGNVTALKGSLRFAQHLQQNLNHQERFYVHHTTYDLEHKIHFILFKTIRLLKQINTNSGLHSRIGNLLLNFPEMPEIKVFEQTFKTMVFNRKNRPYYRAIEIARMILLQYHPDLSEGRNHVLALMFDMNKLWEKFVYVSLQKNKIQDMHLTAQMPKYFWRPQLKYGKRMTIRADIVINMEQGKRVVLDTKWKNLDGQNPSPDDLRQMYAYHEYYNAQKVALVYPGSTTLNNPGLFFPTPTYPNMDKECSIIMLSLPKEARDNKTLVKTWQEEINSVLNNWMNITN
jgi:5-methylcytosine-specific restriction enzyme subunit McrC